MSACRKGNMRTILAPAMYTTAFRQGCLGPIQAMDMGTEEAGGAAIHITFTWILVLILAFMILAAVPTSPFTESTNLATREGIQQMKNHSREGTKTSWKMPIGLTMVLLAREVVARAVHSRDRLGWDMNEGGYGGGRGERWGLGFVEVDFTICGIM